MRSESEEYHMEKEYDFSGGIRARFYRPRKISVTLRLDDDVLLYVKKIAGLRKVRYQTLLNDFLRDSMQRGALE